jgi:Flp pilus assembly pilin Flp
MLPISSAGCQRFTTLDPLVPPTSAPADDETRPIMTHPTSPDSTARHTSISSYASTHDAPDGNAAIRDAGSSTHHPAATHRRLVQDEHGAATAEYAIATMAAVGFAGLLVVIMRSDEIRGILTDLVRNALTFVG